MSITAKVICDSVSEQGIRLTTMLVDYPRIVHAEQLKHRMFSTSAASSRAIPFAKMQGQLTGKPVRFGQANPGMQDKGEHYQGKLIIDDAYQLSDYTPEEVWGMAQASATKFSKVFQDAGYHKQVYNRITEPYQMMRVLITSTEWDNFWWLRNDVAADPTLHETARIMKEAYDASVPQLLKAGEYHLPFVDAWRDKNGKMCYGIDEEDEIHVTLEQAIIVSCARCAAQSFRNTDYDLAKSKQVYDRLVNGDKIHAGALEHVATTMHKQVENIGTHMTRKDYINVPGDPSSWEKGISHSDRNRQLWSGNLRGYIQHRKTVPGENYIG